MFRVGAIKIYLCFLLYDLISYASPHISLLLSHDDLCHTFGYIYFYVYIVNVMGFIYVFYVTALYVSACLSLVVVLCVVCLFVLRGRILILYRGVNNFCHFSMSHSLPKVCFVCLFFFLKMDFIIK